MAISFTNQEALKKLRTMRPSKPISTFFDTLFPEAIPSARQAPLFCDATDFFDEHQTSAKGDKVTFYAHNKLIRRDAAKWRTNRLEAKAPATHALELCV